MSFHITDRYGSMDGPHDTARFPFLLGQLDERPEDTEHGSVAITHESEWCISVSRGGVAILEHLEDGGECHMLGLTEPQVIHLWTLLAEGDIASIQQQPWVPGYP
jgi:hypothetical protein